MYTYRIKDFGNGKIQVVHFEKPILEKTDLRYLSEKNDSYNPLRSASALTQAEAVDEWSYSRDGPFDDGIDIIPDFTSIDEYSEKRKELYKLYNDKRDKNKVFDIARSNVDYWKYFGTLTFDPKLIDRTDYPLCIQKMKSFFKNLNQRFCNKQLKYLCVPELHHKNICENGKHAIHFHFICSDIPVSLLIDSIYNPGSFGITCWHWGISDVSLIRDTQAISMYIAKYLTKEVSFLLAGSHRHYCSQGLNKPFVITTDNISQYEFGKCVWESTKEYHIGSYYNRYTIYEYDLNLVDD